MFKAFITPALVTLFGLSSITLAGGTSGGGTITICGQPIDSLHWTRSMPQIPGYRDYRQAMDTLLKKLPALALELSPVEKKSWQYVNCNPGTLSDDQFEFNTDKSIAFFDSYLIIFAPKFRHIQDKGGSLFHEAIRNTCKHNWSDATNTSETDCTIRNKILIYNRFLHNSEFNLLEFRDMLYKSTGNFYLTADELTVLLNYFKALTNEFLPKFLAAQDTSQCGTEKNTVPLKNSDRLLSQIYLGLPLAKTNHMINRLLRIIYDIGVEELETHSAYDIWSARNNRKTDLSLSCEKIKDRRVLNEFREYFNSVSLEQFSIDR